MRRSFAIVTGIVAGLTTVAVVTTPALAQGGTPSGTRDGTCTATGTAPARAGSQGPGRQGVGQRNGRGNETGARMGNGHGNGRNAAGQSRVPVASGTLTATQRSSLAAMAEEEKLAHDLYVALAAKYPSVVQFDRIAGAESAHLNALRTLLARYGVTDPTAGKAAGEFRSAATQSTYDHLLAGATTSTKALAAGVTVEKADIADLTKALKGVTAPDVARVYTHLRTASQHHLVAFGR